MKRTVQVSDPNLLDQSRALADPTRHAIFELIRDADQPVTVAELTGHFGLNHNAIRQHIAKLRDAGLVVEQRDPPTGPGRPPVRYRVSAANEQLGSSEAWEALSMMLLELLSSGADVLDVGRATGRRLAKEHGTDDTAAAILRDVARRLGFDPTVKATRAGADVVLGRCPFLGPAAESPEIVCELHRGIAEGIVAEAVDDAVVTDLVIHPPKRANCRIKVATASR
jgi:predicted ArsR family transcriptional regulator